VPLRFFADAGNPPPPANPDTRPETRPEGPDGDVPRDRGKGLGYSWWGGKVLRARIDSPAPKGDCDMYFGVRNYGDRLQPEVRARCTVHGGGVGQLEAALSLDLKKVVSRKHCYHVTSDWTIPDMLTRPNGEVPGSKFGSDCDKIGKSSEIVLRRSFTLKELDERNDEPFGERICFDGDIRRDGSFTESKQLTICGAIPKAPARRPDPKRSGRRRDPRVCASAHDAAPVRAQLACVPER
jgi:hypothetical protein